MPGNKDSVFFDFLIYFQQISVTEPIHSLVTIHRSLYHSPLSMSITSPNSTIYIYLNNHILETCLLQNI